MFIVHAASINAIRVVSRRRLFEVNDCHRHYLRSESLRWGGQWPGGTLGPSTRRANNGGPFRYDAPREDQIWEEAPGRLPGRAPRSEWLQLRSAAGRARHSGGTCRRDAHGARRKDARVSVINGACTNGRTELPFSDARQAAIRSTRETTKVTLASRFHRSLRRPDHRPHSSDGRMWPPQACCACT